MITLRKANERGHFNHGWLNTYHTFSFGDYFDPAHRSFRDLRVINEDFVEGGAGFEPHPHRDMEILTYILEGALEHRDSMGNSAVIRPGEVQRMSAGTGVVHSEFNHFKDQRTHLLQIWILPDRKGHVPGYGQKSFEKALADKGFVLVASRSGHEGSISINQDVNLYVGKTLNEKEFVHQIGPDRGAWIQVARGNVTVNGTKATAGDGVALTGERDIRIHATGSAEFLFFDLV